MKTIKKNVSKEDLEILRTELEELKSKEKSLINIKSTNFTKIDKRFFNHKKYKELIVLYQDQISQEIKAMDENKFYTYLKIYLQNGVFLQEGAINPDTLAFLTLLDVDYRKIDLTPFLDNINPHVVIQSSVFGKYLMDNYPEQHDRINAKLNQDYKILKNKYYFKEIDNYKRYQEFKYSHIDYSTYYKRIKGHI